MKRIKKIKVDEVGQTKKISSEKINLLKLNGILDAAREYSEKYPPKSMSEIANIIQGVQWGYQKATEKNKDPSPWKDNILKKIREF